MLKPIKRSKARAGDGRFVIVASKYNARYVEGMLRAARSTLTRVGARSIQVARVPGAFEIPVVAAQIARGGSGDAAPNSRPSAIICLGVILRGETTHAQHIGEAVTRALMRIQLDFGIPVIHEVLLLENEDQARVRCLGKKHNRGGEAAETALEMARVMRELNSGISK